MAWVWVAIGVGLVGATLIVFFAWDSVVNIGDALTIAFRIITHMNDIQRVVPQLLAVIGDGQRVLKEANELLMKIAPELVSAQAAQIQQYDVKWLQMSMNLLTQANLAVDGIYGPLTSAAIRDFQNIHGLEADGWAGILTQAKIVELLHQRGQPVA